jgi:hypothetical protein
MWLAAEAATALRSSVSQACHKLCDSLSQVCCWPGCCARTRRQQVALPCIGMHAMVCFVVFGAVVCMVILAGQQLWENTPCHKRVTSAVSVAMLLRVSSKLQARCCFVCFVIVFFMHADNCMWLAAEAAAALRSSVSQACHKLCDSLSQVCCWPGCCARTRRQQGALPCIDMHAIARSGT